MSKTSKNVQTLGTKFFEKGKILLTKGNKLSELLNAIEITKLLYLIGTYNLA